MEVKDKIIITLLARIVGHLEGIPADEVILAVKKATAQPEKKSHAPDPEIIERLYKLYPGKTITPRGTRSTGKCAKDKARLATLLKTHTPEQIENSIKKYLEECGGYYLKNFSTFLNNLPEYEEERPPKDGFIDF